VLKLRRGHVVSVERVDGRVARAVVELEGGADPRAAVSYRGLTGPLEVGDDVVLNVESRDLELGSGGFDVVCVNLSRGLAAEVDPATHVMKLNYTPIQHAVSPLEEGLESTPNVLGAPVGVLALHGQLAPAAFALSQRAPEMQVGYVQTVGGALPGQLSDTTAELLERRLLSDHVTVAPCFGGPREAITLEGALQAAFERLGWDAALVGPGPGILGSASALGHGGLAALASAHSALALGCGVVLAPRLSSAERRSRHRGLSHHTQTVLRLLLAPVEVTVPGGIANEARHALQEAVHAGGHQALAVEIEDLEQPYLESGLTATTMGRHFEEDRDFMRSGLAGGAALAAKRGTMKGGTDK
jgi:hypothetical protein